MRNMISLFLGAVYACTVLSTKTEPTQAMIRRCAFTDPQILKSTHWQPHRKGPALSKPEGLNRGRFGGTEEQTRNTAFVRYLTFKVARTYQTGD